MAEPGKYPRGDSEPVRSGQDGVHGRLVEVARKHLDSPWLQPLHQPSVAAFEAAAGLLKPEETVGMVLDSGCGTGASTRALAGLHPGSVIVGVDKSRRRLAKRGYPGIPHRTGRVLLVQADLPTFWRLALEAGWKISRHYLLYPNPWPKPSQLQRRWHAHPAMPVIMRLGDVIEMRCNWRVYAEEFAAVAGLITGERIAVQSLTPCRPLSPHERKYLASGHDLFRVEARAAGAGAIR